MMAYSKYQIPIIISKAITASQFWTGMSFNQKTKEYLDSSGNVLAVDMETNFTENLNSRSSK